MTTILDIKKSLNNTLKTHFPSISIYSPDTKEGFARPCFFTKVIPLNVENETVNYTSYKVLVVINYFSKENEEIDNLKMMEDLRYALGMNLRVNQRSFLLRNIRSEIIDGVLQFKFGLNFLVNSDRKKNIGETDRVVAGDLQLEVNRELNRKDD